MKDLFQNVDDGLTGEERLLHAIFGDRDRKTWIARENEAMEFVDSYLDNHPECIEEGATTIEDLHRFVLARMDDWRAEWLNDCKRLGDNMGDEDKFVYATQILAFGQLRWLCEEYLKNTGNDIIHICFRHGCEAAQKIMEKEAEQAKRFKEKNGHRD